MITKSENKCMKSILFLENIYYEKKKRKKDIISYKIPRKIDMNNKKIDFFFFLNENLIF